jgi:hypothetical protein
MLPKLLSVHHSFRFPGRLVCSFLMNKHDARAMQLRLLFTFFYAIYGIKIRATINNKTLIYLSLTYTRFCSWSSLLYIPTCDWGVNPG